MLNVFILIYSGGEGREVHEPFKGGATLKILETSAIGLCHKKIKL
jgi:hypothetical protein